MRSHCLPASLFIVLALASACCAAQTPPSARLGRLFATPGERTLLDGRRGVAASAAPATPGAVAGDPGAPATAPGAGADSPAAPPPLTYNGLVRASTGRTTVWLNAEATAAGPSAKVARGRKSVALRLSSGRELILQPGQTYDAASRTVQELSPAAPPAVPPAVPPAAPASPVAAPGVPAGYIPTDQ